MAVQSQNRSLTRERYFSVLQPAVHRLKNSVILFMMSEEQKIDLGDVELLAEDKPLKSLIAEKTASLDSQGNENSFFMVDLADIISKHENWKKHFPRIEPFYAVKCNDDYAVLKLLADLGTSFDCASKTEISKILNLGVSPTRIIYANPCKQKSYIKYAAKHNVNTLVFDNEEELYKTREIFPDARLVLRISTVSKSTFMYKFETKFGCSPDMVLPLLSKARQLEMNVIGISFHIGVGTGSAEAYAEAIEQANYVFELAQKNGFHFELLNIGGGFPAKGFSSVTFSEVADVVNKALDRYFPCERGIRIIAEPGRYYVTSAYTLVLNVIAKRSMRPNILANGLGSQDKSKTIMYYVNDGLFGSFSCVNFFPNQIVQAQPVKDCRTKPAFKSVIWGPTCGIDSITKNSLLPELNVGDWLFFENMGAYSLTPATDFNGMPRPGRYFFCNKWRWCSVHPEGNLKHSE